MLSVPSSEFSGSLENYPPGDVWGDSLSELPQELSWGNVWTTILFCLETWRVGDKSRLA